MKSLKHTKKVIYSVIFISGLLMFSAAYATMSGYCSDCHTMHNSQGGNPMATIEDYTATAPSGAQIYLLKATCLGCHAQGGAQNIISIGSSEVPQVYHTDATDLAAGNFAYITGAKGTNASDNNGHNLVDFGVAEGKQAPGRRHSIGTIPTAFTCAGHSGCHGLREGTYGSGLTSMAGAHHNNTGNKMDVADTVANSYRFLYKVKGLENNGQVSSSTKWQNANTTNHNEYLGEESPADYDDAGVNCSACHGFTGAGPYYNTMSGFCGTCHGYFHLLRRNSACSGNNHPDCDGIGEDKDSPFRRHPTDVVLPGAGTEYFDYNENTAVRVYNTTIPVARPGPNPPDTMSSAVTPGTDIVMCLSCHVAHASDHYKMLRWDYKNADLGTALSGCNVCHTSKD